MKRLACYLLTASAWIAQAAEPVLSQGTAASVPPPAQPPFEVGAAGAADAKGSPVHAQANVYSIGDPSPEEQLYLELINRARANPPAEGIILGSIADPQILGDYSAFSIDLTLMRTQFAAIAASQPLAMNASLTTAARSHSQDMFANVFQDHNSSDGTTAFDRIKAVGYIGQAAENIYANAKSVLHGHAAFEVDWGGPASNGGMQSPPGHRVNIHNPVFREVGIGVVLGFNQVPGKQPLGQVGPQLVTQDFGVAQNSTPFITGVAYYDLNGNGAYDIGEGIGNVHVTVAGASFEAVTARSGGYAIPVPASGNYSVTFSGPGFASLTRQVSVAGSKNQKLDFVPAYAPPVVTGPATASVNRSNFYAISAVGGAADYQWHVFQTVPAASEGAENDSTRLTITQSGVYDVIEGILFKSGSNAFHLITPTDAPRSQYITLSPTYLISSNSVVSFQSMLGFTTSDQHAQVQVSADNGLTWTTVYNQDGNSDNPETSWQLRSAALSQFAGKAIRIRFALDFIRGIFVNSTDLSVGWLIDDIQFPHVQEVINDTVSAANGTTFTYIPTGSGNFQIQARARTGHNYLDWGPTLAVTAAPATGTPQLQLAVSTDGSGQIVIDATLLSGADPASLTVETTSDLGGAWQSISAPTVNLSPTQFRISIPPPYATPSFFRLRKAQ